MARAASAQLSSAGRSAAGFMACTVTYQTCSSSSCSCSPGETAALELCQMRRRFKGGAAREHAAQLQRAPGERDLAAAAELPLHAA